MLASGVDGAVRLVAVSCLLLASSARGDSPRLFEIASTEADAVTVAIDAAQLRDLTGPFVIERFPLAAGETVDLEIERFRVAGPETRIVVGHDNVPLAFDLDSVILLRGGIAGEPDSHVFLALSEWGSVGKIERGGAGRPYFLSGKPSELKVRREGDEPTGHPGALAPDLPFCGAQESFGRLRRSPAVPVGVLPELTQEIELAIETDFELFSLFNDLDATCAYIVELWAAVSDIYLRDVNTRIKLTFIRLWDDPDDLFNVEDPLNIFVAYWEANMGAVHRDAAHFTSGRRNFPYGGVAYLQALCTSFAYGISGYMLGFFDDPNVPSAFGYDVHVNAHELGHNCGPLHTPDYGIDNCDNLFGVAERSTIMSYCSQTRSGGNANTDLRFHSIVQDIMRAHIFSAGCIVDDCNGNGIDDAEDISSGFSDDVNGNGVADECEDCNNNGTLDDADIAGGSPDLNGNGVPDECEPDCNLNGVPDDMDIAMGNATDLYGNNIPDFCELDCNGDGNSDYTEIQADMTLDIDRNARLDSCQDCDGDRVSDMEALAGAHNAWVASAEAGTGLFEFHAVSGVRVKTGEAGVLSNPQEVLITPAGRILVSSAGDDRVVEFDVTGAHVGDFVAAGAGGLDLPGGMALRPGGNLLVASRLTNSVLEYDGTSGASLGEFVAAGDGGLVAPWGVAYGPHGNLFVTSLDGRIIEYDGVKGEVVADLVSAADNGGLSGPHGILFKPDGNLLVASTLTDQILEYEAKTGAFVGQFNNGGTADVLTLDLPWALRIGPDGYLHASRAGVSISDDIHAGNHHSDTAHLHVNSTRIYSFDLANGNFVRSYVTGHDTGLSFPTGFDFFPGDATDCNFNQIPDTCDIASGFSDDVNGNGTPDECEAASGCPDLDGDDFVATADLLMLLGAWGSDPGGPPDFNGDGLVATADLLFLLGAWGPCPG